MRGGGEQEVGVRLKGVETLGEGQRRRALEWRDGPLTVLTLCVKQLMSGVWNTFSLGYIQNKLQLLYKGPPLQFKAINNGN